MTTLVTGQVSDDPSTASRSQKWWFADAVVLACYTAVAVCVMGRMWVNPDHRVPPGHEPDPNLFKWFIAYAARAVTHGENPLFTTMQGAPEGVNLMGNTSVLGLGIPFTPVTLLFGAGVSFTAMLTLGLAGTAAGWFYVFRRHLGSSQWAAAIGGGLCGFAPALVAHALGHLHLTAQFVIPFIVSFVLRLRDTHRPVRDGVILGLLITYQVFIGEEVLLLAALGLGLFTGVYALFHWPEVRRSWRGFGIGMGVAAGVATVLLAYPLWMQFLGPGSYHGLDPAAQGFGADVKAYSTFATQTIFGNRAANATLAQNYAEENSFFGWPLLLVTTAVAVWMWRQKFIWVLALVGGIFAIFSLSAFVRVDGRLVTTHGPWALFAKLPLFDAVIPSRFGMIVIPIIAVIITVGIDRLRAQPASAAVRWAGLSAIAAAVITVFPIPLPGGGQSPVPRFIASGQWKPYVPEGRTLVTVPLTSPEFSGTLRWAAATHIGYAIPRGYFLAPEEGKRGERGTFWQPERYTARILDQVAREGRVPAITDADRAAARADLGHWRASAVVLATYTTHAEALRETVDELFGPGKVVDDVYLWDVRTLAP